MEITQTLNALYHKDYRLIYTDLGLTNRIYYIEYKGKIDAVLRIPNPHADIFVHRELERKIQKAVRGQDMDFEEIYYDEDKAYRITRFVDNLKGFQNAPNPNKYKEAIRLIKKFHQLAIHTNIEFGLKNKYLIFKKQIKKPMMDFDKYESFLDAYTNLPEKAILSHNDLVDGNILFNDQRAYLIDYEYAGLNHPYFDLMSLISENNINDLNIRHSLYQYFFEAPISTELEKKLHIIENAANLLWAAWANMFYDTNHNEEYRQIFKMKKEAIEGQIL